MGMISIFSCCFGMTNAWADSTVLLPLDPPISVNLQYLVPRVTFFVGVLVLAFITVVSIKPRVLSTSTALLMLVLSSCGGVFSRIGLLLGVSDGGFYSVIALLGFLLSGFALAASYFLLLQGALRVLTVSEFSVVVAAGLIIALALNESVAFLPAALKPWCALFEIAASSLCLIWLANHVGSETAKISTQEEESTRTLACLLIRLVFAVVCMSVLHSLAGPLLWANHQGPFSLSIEESFLVAVSLAVICFVVVRILRSSLAAGSGVLLAIALMGFVVLMAQAMHSTGNLSWYEIVSTVCERCSFFAVALILFSVSCSLSERGTRQVLGTVAGLYVSFNIVWCIVSLQLTDGAIITPSAAVLIGSLFAIEVAMLVHTPYKVNELGLTWASHIVRATIKDSESDLATNLGARCQTIAQKYGLSPRETEVLELLSQGNNRRTISEKLVLADGTVKTHIQHIYAKLGTHNRQELMEKVLNSNLLPF